MYSVRTVVVDKKTGNKKFSPFNTISRQSRDSYLLRVTNEPNTHTNYILNDNMVSPLNRRATIDRAKFNRIIGDLKTQDYHIDLPAFSKKRCIQSQTLSPASKRPFTVSDHQNWRKTHEHINFHK